MSSAVRRTANMDDRHAMRILWHHHGTSSRTMMLEAFRSALIALPAASLLRGTHPAHAARRARAPAASTPHAPATRHHARTTTHDDEKMLRAHTGTKPKTPIDGASENWVPPRQRGPVARAGALPSSSHASVA